MLCFREIAKCSSVFSRQELGSCILRVSPSRHIIRRTEHPAAAAAMLVTSQRMMATREKPADSRNSYSRDPLTLLEPSMKTTLPEEASNLSIILKTEFAVDRNISDHEWRSISQKILGLELRPKTRVTPVNIQRVIWNMCGEMDRSQIAISYCNFQGGLASLEGISLITLVGMIANVTINQDQEEFVISLVDKCFDAKLNISYWKWLSIIALSKTKDWKKGVAIAKEIKEQTAEELEKVIKDVSYSGRYHSARLALVALALKACQQGEETLMWDLMRDPIFHGHPTPHRVVQVVERQETVYRAWVDHSLRQADPLDQLDKLYTYFADFDISLSSAMAKYIQVALKESNSGLYAATTNIRHAGEDGVCSCCGATLQPHSMSRKDLLALKEGMVALTLRQDDIYKASNPKEFERFNVMLEKQGTFDYVIDGQNVTYRSLARNLKDKWIPQHGLLESVRHLAQGGKRVLVVDRYTLRKYPHFRELRKLCHFFLLDKVSNDDLYVIIAALNSGDKCRVVSGDHFRQTNTKIFNKDPELGRLFTYWLITHQVSMRGFKTAEQTQQLSPILLDPPSYSVRANKTGSNWHIPLLQDLSHTNRVLYDGRSARWLCVGKES